MNVVSFVSVLPVLLGMATAVWGLSVLRKDAGIADIAWGFGFVLAAVVYALPERPLTPRGVLVLSLVTLWGVRLGAHLFWRNWGRKEDLRYTAMRETWGARFWWVSLFTVFWLQAFLLWGISAPVHHSIAADTAPLGVVAAAGVALWCVGMYFETVADWQLLRFKADPTNAGKVLEAGLWRYSRHPNYFGEFVLWWGIFLIAAETVSGLWTVVGPLLISFLLLRVSGVPMLDKLMRNTKPDYRHYVERTNAFFPWFPR